MQKQFPNVPGKLKYRTEPLRGIVQDRPLWFINSSYPAYFIFYH